MCTTKINTAEIMYRLLAHPPSLVTPNISSNNKYSQPGMSKFVHSFISVHISDTTSYHIIK